MNVARVFARKTSFSPMDADAYYGLPQWFTPKYNKVLVSVTFTWDIEKGYYLKKQWGGVCKDVRIGGPAFNAAGNSFTPGIFLKPGCVFTSRGCPNECPWCFVPRREGKIRELPVIHPGNIIMDNNLLACSKAHIRAVFKMLKDQKDVVFNQGLDSRLITDKIIEQIRGLHIKEIFLACDYDGAYVPLKRAVTKLKKYFKAKNTIRCYVLIGYKNDTIKKAEARLIKILKLGVMPFAMLYRDSGFTKHTIDWRRFQRFWCRPALYVSKYGWFK